MSKDFTSDSLELKPNDADVLIRFVGELNENLKLVEKTFRVKIFQNGNVLGDIWSDDASAIYCSVF